MGIMRSFLLIVLLVSIGSTIAGSTSNGGCKILDPCSSDSNCEVGTYCSSCFEGFSGSRCVRSMITDQFKLVNNSMPFNKYAYLTTHNSFAIVGEPSHTGVPRSTFTNQEDTVTQQLNNGVRALMLDTYDFEGEVWLCHSIEEKCNVFTAFEPAVDTLKEIEAFLDANPSEIITLILEDYVHAPNGLTNVFNQSGLLKFWFPLSRMPLNGQDWPLVSDMVAKNQRLLVFTSMKSKQNTEGIAYQWDFMVENNYGDDGMKAGNCSNRTESAYLTDTSKSLVLINYFPSIPIEAESCGHNSAELINMLRACHGAAGNRWANFVAVDFYKRSEGRGAFQATDMLNGRLLCGCEDVHACAVRFSRNINQFSPFAPYVRKLGLVNNALGGLLNAQNPLASASSALSSNVLPSTALPSSVLPSPILPSPQSHGSTLNESASMALDSGRAGVSPLGEFASTFLLVFRMFS